MCFSTYVDPVYFVCYHIFIMPPYIFNSTHMRNVMPNRSLLHVMGELRDRTLLAFILSRLERYVPFLVPFPGLARALLKALLELWGGGGGGSNSSKSKASASEDEGADGEHAERVRIKARPSPIRRRHPNYAFFITQKCTLFPDDCFSTEECPLYSLNASPSLEHTV